MYDIGRIAIAFLGALIVDGDAPGGRGSCEQEDEGLHNGAGKPDCVIVFGLDVSLVNESIGCIRGGLRLMILSVKWLPRQSSWLYKLTVPQIKWTDVRPNTRLRHRPSCLDPNIPSLGNNPMLEVSCKGRKPRRIAHRLCATRALSPGSILQSAAAFEKRPLNRVVKHIACSTSPSETEGVCWEQRDDETAKVKEYQNIYVSTSNERSAA